MNADWLFDEIEQLTFSRWDNGARLWMNRVAGKPDGAGLDHFGSWKPSDRYFRVNCTVLSVFECV